MILQPGIFDDPLKISIWHEPLVVNDTPQIGRVFSQKLLDSLDPGWSVLETIDTKRVAYYYSDPEGKGDHASWTHPNPNVSLDEDSFLVTDTSSVDITAIKPDYDALSYTWGTPEDEETLLVGSSAKEVLDAEASLATLQIRQNLAAALRYLRSPHTPRTLWIDAVCINQTDLEERGSQVSRMGSIFKNASRVVVWLGIEVSNFSFFAPLKADHGKNSDICCLVFNFILAECGEAIF